MALVASVVLFAQQQSVLDGALQGALRGAIIGGVCGGLLVVVVAVVKRFTRRPPDDRDQGERS